MVGRKRWKCNCDWISSASRSIEVAVRKLTGAPGSRSLGQPFHRSNPTIENSVASGVYSSPRLQRWTLHPIFGYFRVIKPPRLPFLPPSRLFSTIFANYLSDRAKSHPSNCPHFPAEFKYSNYNFSCIYQEVS